MSRENEKNTAVCCKFTQLHSYQILLKFVNNEVIVKTKG